MCRTCSSGFRNKHPGDDRPRKALETVHRWVNGESKTSEVRKVAFASHAAARDATSHGAIAAAVQVVMLQPRYMPRVINSCCFLCRKSIRRSNGRKGMALHKLLKISSQFTSSLDVANMIMEIKLIIKVLKRKSFSSGISDLMDSSGFLSARIQSSHGLSSGKIRTVSTKRL